jgi:hypothetical protein
LVLALGALLGESKLFAQGDVIFACLNTATGAVRIVFGGSLCKANESPLQWNVAGQPGPQDLLVRRGRRESLVRRTWWRLPLRCST